jgi:hypothetical protein
MDYSVEDLPQECADAVNPNTNLRTRNARFRDAACQHYQLRWHSVGGNGNCFFQSVSELLQDARLEQEPTAVTPDALRVRVIAFFRSCLNKEDHLSERLTVEIQDEVNRELSCSNHKSFNGQRLNGYVPSTVEEYLDASSQNGVWVQGIHWLRGISCLFNVRVAVIIYGQPIVRFFGSGAITIFLYKVDPECHYEPLLHSRVAAEPPPICSRGSCCCCRAPAISSSCAQ